MAQELRNPLGLPSRVELVALHVLAALELHAPSGSCSTPDLRASVAINLSDPRATLHLLEDRKWVEVDRTTSRFSRSHRRTITDEGRAALRTLAGDVAPLFVAIERATRRVDVTPCSDDLPAVTTTLSCRILFHLFRSESFSTVDALARAAGEQPSTVRQAASTLRRAGLVSIRAHRTVADGRLGQRVLALAITQAGTRALAASARQHVRAARAIERDGATTPTAPARHIEPQEGEGARKRPGAQSGPRPPTSRRRSAAPPAQTMPGPRPFDLPNARWTVLAALAVHERSHMARPGARGRTNGARLHDLVETSAERKARNWLADAERSGWVASEADGQALRWRLTSPGIAALSSTVINALRVLEPAFARRAHEAGRGPAHRGATKAELQLSIAQIVGLAAIVWSPSAAERAVATALGCSTSAARDRIDRMVQHGFLARHPSQRGTLLLTGQGRRVLLDEGPPHLVDAWRLARALHGRTELPAATRSTLSLTVQQLDRRTAAAHAVERERTTARPPPGNHDPFP